MLPFIYILLGIGIHLVFDWFLQPREMAKCKSTDWRCLLGHAVVVWAGAMLFYSIVMTPGSLMFVVYALAYGALHALQDRVIWCWYKRKQALSGTDPIDDPLFYTTLGIDQSLHLTVLFYFASLLI